jgi:hypothetical protein
MTTFEMILGDELLPNLLRLKPGDEVLLVKNSL